MKKYFKIVISLFLLLIISSCEKHKNEYNLTFDSNGGSNIESMTIVENEKAKEPKIPTKDGYRFEGWYKDSECTVIFDFNKENITEDTILYAKWEIEISGYYAPMTGHLDSSFKKTLHTLLKQTHKTQITYTPGVWDALKELDEDPNNPDNIICLYTGRSIPKANQDKGSSGENIWNREHVWPNSHGFSTKDYKAYTDIHHLYASEKNINATRGNKDFNTVSNGNSDSYGNKWNADFFEPRDEVKGDIARAMFYMVVRYADPNELVLTLVDETTTSSSNKTGKLGFLSTLLEWNKIDPVSKEERERNEKAYQLQGNKNPFIDYPEWIEYLYPTV